MTTKRATKAASGPATSAGTSAATKRAGGGAKGKGRSRATRGRGRVAGAAGADPGRFRLRLGELVRERTTSPGWVSVRAGLSEGLVQRWLRGEATPRSWQPLWNVLCALESLKPLDGGVTAEMFTLAGIPCPVPDESGFPGRASGVQAKTGPTPCPLPLGGGKEDGVPAALGASHPLRGATERLAEAAARHAVGGDGAVGTVQAGGATDTTSGAAARGGNGASAYDKVRLGARTPVVAKCVEGGGDGAERWLVVDNRGERVAVVFSHDMAGVVCGAINGLPEFLAVASEVIALLDGPDLTPVVFEFDRVRRLIEVSRRGLELALPAVKVGA